MKKSEKLREVAEVIAALDLKFPFSEIVDHLSEELSACLNPYSTGSNSNFSMDGCLCRYWRIMGSC